MLTWNDSCRRSLWLQSKKSSYSHARFSAGEGVVTGQSSLDGWVAVKWDKGGEYRYRFGADEAYDLEAIGSQLTTNEVRES